jgi:hypothetical protein
MQIASLFARIGLKTDEAKAKSFTKNIKFAKTALIGVVGAAAGASAAIVKVTNDAMKAAVAFKQFEVETGASAQELQKWQAVAEQTNQSAESVTAAIKAITSNQEKIRLGQGDISGYQLLGIDPRQDPFEILEQLRDKTAGMTQAMKRNILAQMGIGAGMIQTLELSREQFDAMASRAFIISPQAIETLNKSKAMMDQAGRGIQYLKTQIAVGLAPGIERLTKGLIDFIKANEAGFVRGFQKAFDILQKLLRAIGRFAGIINNLVSGTIGWNTALKLVLASMLALNSTFLLSPIGLFTAAIILLVAVIDDLAVYARGGKSIFGEMVEKMPALGAMFDWVQDFIALIAAFRDGDTLAIDKILEDWGAFGDIIQKIVDGLEKIREFTSSERFGLLMEGGTTEDGREVTGLGRKFGVSMVNPPGGNTSNTNVTVNVDGSGTPEETGRAVAGALRREFNGASAQRGRNE